MAALLVKRLAKMSVEQANDTFLRFARGRTSHRSFVGRFRAMLPWRKSRALDPWIEAALGAGFASLAQFARTLQRDMKAFNWP
ncbi:MAG TPA: hypothetical protein VGM27_10160 [Acidobacteriaceae bacterium]